MSQRGQVLVFILVLFPLLILAAGVFVRAGMTAYVHSKVQKFLDKKALDALAIEAQGLEALGKMNDHARAIIDARRKVDAQIIATAGTPAVIPLMTLRNILYSSQQVTALAQKKIKTETELLAYKNLSTPAPKFYSRNTKLEFSPRIPRGAHSLSESLILHITPVAEYAGEVGAPLQVDGDFHSAQKMNISAVVKTESYLPLWSGFKKLPDMKVFSAAIIQMESLEGKWTVKLEKAQGNLSWN